MSEDNLPDFNEICEFSILCQQKQCVQKHQKKFQGLCIKLQRIHQNYLSDEDQDFVQKNCGDKKCELFHTQRDMLIKYLEEPTLWGYYCFNLCQTQCQNNSCCYIHLKSIRQYCIKNFINACSKGSTCREQKIHIKWTDLIKIVQRRYKINNEITPENLKEFPKTTPQYLNQYRIENIFGECSQQFCQKKHKNWENIYFDFKFPFTNCIKKDYFIKEEFKNTVNSQERARLICEKQKFLNFKSQINQSNVIDIVFVMDLTGSMKPWLYLQKLALHIKKIMNEFSKPIPNQIVKVGFIGYRDTLDTDKLVYRDQTTNFDEIMKFIQKQEAKGGNDSAEDVISGLQQIFNLNLSKSCESMLCVILLADSPCHGKQYHDLSPQDDEQYDKVEGTPLEDVMKQLKDLKKKNYFFCFKITEDTNKMYKIMQNIMQDSLEITTTTNPDLLASAIAFSLNTSYEKSQYQYDDDGIRKTEHIPKKNVNKNANQVEIWYKFQEQKKNKITGRTALQIEITEMEDLEFSNSINSSLSQQIVSQRSVTNVTLNSTKTKSSYKTLIYKAFDAINNQQIVIKISQNYLQQMEKNNNDPVKMRKLIEDAEEQAEIRYLSSLYACKMAELYRQQTKKLQQREKFPPIFYATPILYKLKQPFFGLQKVYAESYIQNTFRKYTTNEKVVKQEHYYYTVFSHFSFEESNKLLVMTDLQGSYSIFSDPSIQINQTLLTKLNEQNQEYLLMKDKTNLKDKGIAFFQQSHRQCSTLCDILGLKPLSDQIYVQNSIYTRPNDELLQIVCDRCGEFSDISYENYYDQKEETKCLKCQNAQEELMVCKCCKCEFKQYINIILKTNQILNFCDGCVNEECFKELNHPCFYCESKCEKISKLESIKICGQEVWLCKDALDYLTFLECSLCKKPYEFDILLSKERYFKPYKCCE